MKKSKLKQIIKEEILNEVKNNTMLNHLDKIKEANKTLDKMLKDRGYV